ncbi:MAG: dephospho-CoA kinase [Chitinophagia bacterium]|jgi:dephospho-CoA kinase
MVKVGLTGGIGSGKTMVAKIFATLGAPVYHADARAKELMESDPKLIEQIKTNFSEKAYLNGKLNTAFLSGIVFQDKEKLRLLNSIVHPSTIADGKEWMNRQKTAYAIKEAALIFESGSQAEYDFIIGVHAPRSMRILRTMKRDNAERDKIIERMEQQLDESMKMKLCDVIIENDDEKMLIPQVLEIHQRLLLMDAEGKKND